jgi:hypothetical protein
MKLTLPDLYLVYVDEPGWEVVIEGGWPKKLVPICDWGCQCMSAIDCSTTEGEIVDYLKPGGLRRKRMAFAQWLEAWVNGEALWLPTAAS